MIERPLANLPPPQSRGDLVVEAIRNAIIGGDLEPGSPLVERELAGRLGVSKTPVREALRTLSRTGLVTHHPYRGMAVREIDSQMIDEVYEVRLLLEPEAVRRSVVHLTSEDLRQLERLLSAARSATSNNDRTALSKRNREFHRALYTKCGNQLMSSTLDRLQDMLAFIAVASWRQNPTFHDEASEHASIFEAATRGDEDEVARRLADHIRGFRDRMRALFPATTDDESEE